VGAVGKKNHEYPTGEETQEYSEHPREENFSVT
jgi:hypothetical protein